MVLASYIQFIRKPIESESYRAVKNIQHKESEKYLAVKISNIENNTDSLSLSTSLREGLKKINKIKIKNNGIFR